MRHVPTALYIDTQVFVKNRMNLNVREFNQLKETFLKGGIRLLVPAIMERELFRHYQRKANELAASVIKAHATYPVSNLELGTLPSKEDLAGQCFDELKQQWGEFTSHFVVEPLPLVGNIEDVVDWYFNNEPPFHDKKHEFPDAMIVSALDAYRQEKGANIAVVSKDGDLRGVCEIRRYMAHFPDLDKYVEAFTPELSSDKLDSEPIDPTKPITTEDLTELKAILQRGNDATEIEVKRVMSLLEARGTNYDYFFRHAADKIWFDPLKEGGYFSDPPAAELDAEGRRRASWWPPLQYLHEVYGQIPEEVLSVLDALPVSDNPTVSEGIVDIVLKAREPELTLRMKDHILAFVDHATWNQDKLIALLKMPFLFEKAFAEFTESLLLKIVEFRPDPQAQEKVARHKADPKDWGTSLKPQPKLDPWVYQEVLKNGVCPLTEQEPYQVARILIDATASMLRLSMHEEQISSGKDQDLSEIWCPRLNKVTRSYGDVKQMLVKSMTSACERVYEASPEMVEPLDQVLRNLPWLLFSRLRQHLYAHATTEQVLPWIREFILGYEGYDKWDLHFEMQRMIREACSSYGSELLTGEELSSIVTLIKSGPPQDAYREWLGADYTDERYLQRKRYFHRKQLRPFEAILTGEDASYYQELCEEHEGSQLEDEDYAPYGEVKSGTVSYQSPIKSDELANKRDEELLQYINEWQESQRGDDFIEINIHALASQFQALFEQAIIPDTNRLQFWWDNKDNIDRPVYVRAIIEAIQAHVKESNFDQLDDWFKWCDWVLSHSDSSKEEGEQTHEESREKPDWGSSRRAVGDFVESCLSKDLNVPISARESIAQLLHQLCTQYSYRLDEDHPVILSRDDQLTEAINVTRSRALETLVKFGYWVRSYDEAAEVPEIASILNERFSDNTEYPLTLPEYAILATRYAGIFTFDQQWATENKAKFFPQDNFPAWVEAFGCLLHYTNPFQAIYDALKDDYIFALDHLPDIVEQQKSDHLVESLGQQLFTYYLWEVFPLRGEDSLLERYYEQTTSDRRYWTHLFDHIGRSFNNSSPKLGQSLKDRAMAFFDWRLEVAEKEELREFTFWLEAKCFDPDWRLNSYLKILDVAQARDIKITIDLKTLRSLLEDHTAKVVECLAKLTESFDEGDGIYFMPDDVRAILRAGFDSEDEAIRNHAEQAKENLLRAGRHEFLDD
ncbi:MAG: PIN domain-containing protein [Akkermansiaceae bacterium]